MSQPTTSDTTKRTFAVASLKSLLKLFDEAHLELICDNGWLSSAENITRDAMKAEHVRSDETLRELVLQAFENITGMSNLIDGEYLKRLFSIFHLMYPVLDEAKKNPPAKASQRMRDLLRTIVDEDEMSTAVVQKDNEDEQEDGNKDDNGDIENGSSGDGEDGDNDDNDDDSDDDDDNDDDSDDDEDKDEEGVEDQMKTKRQGKQRISFDEIDERSDDERQSDRIVISPRPSRHSRVGTSKGVLTTDTMKSSSSGDESEVPPSVSRRRVRRGVRRTVVASDEDEQEDTRHAPGDATSSDENEDERSDCASTEQTARKTRSRTLREKTSRDLRSRGDEDAPKTKISRKTRSIDVKHMKGDRRCDACIKREFESCDVGIDANGMMMACQVCSRLKRRCRYSKGGKGKQTLKESNVEGAKKKDTRASKTRKTPKPAESSREEVRSPVKSRRLKPVVELPPVRFRGKPKVISEDISEGSDPSPPRKKARIEATPPQATTSKHGFAPKKPHKHTQRHSSRNPTTTPTVERTATPSPPPPTHVSQSPPPAPSEQSPRPPSPSRSPPPAPSEQSPRPPSPSQSPQPAPPSQSHPPVRPSSTLVSVQHAPASPDPMRLRPMSPLATRAEFDTSNRVSGRLVSIPDLHHRDKASRIDAQHRLKLVERIGRLRSNAALSRMEFEDAKKRLETDEESLRIAQEALMQWDANATEAVIASTERMSIDPDVSISPAKGKGKEKETLVRQ